MVANLVNSAHMLGLLVSRCARGIKPGATRNLRHRQASSLSYVILLSVTAGLVFLRQSVGLPLGRFERPTESQFYAEFHFM